MDDEAPEERVARARQFVARLLRGELFVPSRDEPLYNEPLVAEDIVYLNVRGLAISDPGWLSQLLDAEKPEGSLRELVQACTDPSYSPLHDMYYFERDPWRWWAIRERIFINSRADETPKVAKHLVDAVLDKAGLYPGVELLRIRGPETVGRRIDGITVFTSIREGTARVVTALADYRAKHRGHFMQETVPASDPVLAGVSIGEEPSGDLFGIESFVGLRSRLIHEAMVEAKKRGHSESGFRELVDERFRENGIDPSAPHRNLSSEQPAQAPFAVARKASKRRWWWPFT